MTANQVNITEGSGKSVATETVGGLDFQKVEIYGGGGASVLAVQANGSIPVSILGTVPITGTLTSSFVLPSSMVSAVTSIVTSTSQTSVLTTAPSAQRNYISQITVTNGSATGTFVDIMDGPNVIFSGYAAASGGGFSAAFPTPLKQTNTVQSLDMKARTQASIITAIVGFTAA